MRNIVLLGLVSCFIDISTEMVYPLIPLYLTAVFGATPALIGIIEGVAESVASLLRVFSGYLSDKYQKKKPLAFFGYSTALVYKILLILSTSWIGILFARIFDRLGKGVRTAPRDVLVFENAEKGQLGNAYGLHKSLDMAGAAIGILIAFILVRNSGGQFDFKNLFLISIIPAIIGLIILSFVSDNKGTGPKKEPLNLLAGFKQLDKQLKIYLLVIFVFTLGNSSNAFLLLRAQNVGYDDAMVIFMYFVYHLVCAIFAKPLSKLSDKIGRKKLLISGYLAFALVYFLFAFGSTKAMILTAFIIYGVYTALITGVERAFIAEISPKHLKGTMLGLSSTLVGVALLPASIIAGFLWDFVSPAMPFIFGASLSLLAALILTFVMKPKTVPEAAQNT